MTKVFVDKNILENIKEYCIKTKCGDCVFGETSCTMQNTLNNFNSAIPCNWDLEDDNFNFNFYDLEDDLK